MSDEFIEQYSNLIYSLTKYFEGYDKEDLYQAGCVGLINAKKNYDDTKDTKFSTFAYFYILGEMKKLVREDKQIRVSRGLIKLNYKIEKAKIILSQELMREPSIEEISSYLNIDVSKLKEATMAIYHLISIDSTISLNEGEVSLNEVIAKPSIDMNTLVALKEEVKNLTEEERKLVIERFIESKSQSEVATTLGMTQVGISRLEKKVKEKIKIGLS